MNEGPNKSKIYFIIFVSLQVFGLKPKVPSGSTADVYYCHGMKTMLSSRFPDVSMLWKQVKIFPK